MTLNSSTTNSILANYVYIVPNFTNEIIASFIPPNLMVIDPCINNAQHKLRVFYSCSGNKYRNIILDPIQVSSNNNENKQTGLIDTVITQ